MMHLIFYGFCVHDTTVIPRNSIYTQSILFLEIENMCIIIVFVSPEYFNTLLQADFSPVSSPYRAAEEQTYTYFWDFLNDCEGKLTIYYALCVI